MSIPRNTSDHASRSARGEPDSVAPEPAASDAGQRLVCTWLFADPPGDDSFFDQVPVGRSSTETFQATYWRCVSTFFITSTRLQSDARHILFTNTVEIPTVDGLDIASLLQALGVEIVDLPLTFRVPVDYHHSWRNQFYVFDIVQHLHKIMHPADTAIVLDSDCVWIRDPTRMWEALRSDRVLTYRIDYPPEKIISGISLAEMNAIASRIAGRPFNPPISYCGGELIALDQSSSTALTEEFSGLWQTLNDLHRRGEAKFCEEAQTLSYIYRILDYPIGNANPFIKRLWTGSFGIENNVRAEDLDLTIWHVPLEKRLGLNRFFEIIARQGWQSVHEIPLTEYPYFLGRLLGIPRNSATKKMLDFVKRVSDRVRYH